MGILGALFSGVSGLDVYSSAIEVIGNNIANAATPGFKASRAQFSDILSQSLTGAQGGNQIGRGVQLSAVESIFTQGSFETSNQSTDLAVDGQGFFIVKNSDGTFYTRDGQFIINEAGLLVNSRGDRVQGYTLDNNGNIAGIMGDLSLTATNSPPNVTSAVDFVANMDASADPIGAYGSLLGAAVTDSFVIVSGTNNQLVFDDGTGGGPFTADLIADGGLTSGTPASGTALATAIKTAIEATNGSADTYTVTYDASTDRFTILNDAGNTNTLTLLHNNAGSTASATLGFNATSSGALSAAQSDVSDNQVAFNVVTGTNDTFTITIDDTLTATATLSAGQYTGEYFAQEIQRAINAADDSGSNLIRNVTVNYNANAGTDLNRFRIVSQTAGADQSIDIPSTGQVITVEGSSVAVTTPATFLTQTGIAGGTAYAGTGGFDPATPATSSNFSTAVTIYDSLGTYHALNVYFLKVGANWWEYHGLVDGGDLVGGTSGVAQDVISGKMRFTPAGALDIEERYANTGVFNFRGGATQGQTVALDFGTSLTTDNGLTGLDGVTQFAGPSAIIGQTQDGYTTGTLSSISTNQTGDITGIFSNGQTRAMARIALANFTSPDGLNAVGSNLFSETQQSGQPIIGQAQSSGFGTIFSNSVELSNVDIAEEFVQLIKQQQAFQANARVISATDELLKEIVNLVR